MRNQKRKGTCSQTYRDTARNAVADTAVVLILIIVFSILGVVGHDVFNDLNDDINSSSGMSNRTKDTTNRLFHLYPALLDDLYLMAFFLLVIFLVVSVFFLDTHPILLFLNLIMLIFVLIAGGLLGNAYDDMMTDSSLTASANQFPYMSHINANFITYSIIIGFIVLGAMFIKLRRG